MTDMIDDRLAALFGEVLDTGGKTHLIVPDQLATTDFEIFDLDSLEKFDLVMKVEDAFGIALDQEAVIACRTLTELGGLVRAARPQG